MTAAIRVDAGAAGAAGAAAATVAMPPDVSVIFRVAFADIAALAFEKGQLSERMRREAMARGNFERYFTPSHAARLATEPDAAKLGGGNRHVAVLFSDVRDFTPLAESMPPSEMARLITEYFSEMVDCVLRHGGTVDKFMGDAVMAQWGAPVGTGDEADCALETALDMMSALAWLNERWKADGRPTLQMGIGLHYGEVFAGNIGSEHRLEYTLIGDVVNTTSRLCAAAGAGEILASDEFCMALKGPWVVSDAVPVWLKGKSHPVMAHRIAR